MGSWVAHQRRRAASSFGQLSSLRGSPVSPPLRPVSLLRETADPAPEAATWCRSPEPRPRGFGGIPAAATHPTCAQGPSRPPGGLGAGSRLPGRLREDQVPGLQMPPPAGKGRVDGFGGGTGTAVSREQRGFGGPAAPGGRGPGARGTASPAAVCSTATRGRSPSFCIQDARVSGEGGRGVTCAHPFCGLEGTRRILAFPRTLLGGPMGRALRPLGMSRTVTPGDMRPPGGLRSIARLHLQEGSDELPFWGTA